MPLPIAPTVDMGSLPEHQINEHHHFYPRLSPVLRDTLGGRALRVSRIQRVATTQHNFGDKPFHKFFPVGPDIPTDPDIQLGMCVLACAGYLPGMVVDTSGGEPVVRNMKNWEYSRLSQPNVAVEPLPYQVKRFRDRRCPGLSLVSAKERLVRSRERQATMSYKNLVYGFDPMKQFMLSRILALDLEAIDPSKVRSFVDYGNAEAGLCLLGIGAAVAAENATVVGEQLNDVYASIASDGRLHSLMPESAATLIEFKLGRTSHRMEILPILKSALSNQREQRVA